MTMIADDVLRDLFRTESSEHLQRLDELLLLLEQTPADSTLLEEAFREAHSLKGAARMLGLATIQMAAHGLEDILNQARQGTRRLDPAGITSLLAELSVIRQRVTEAVGVAATTPEALAPVTPAAAAPEPDVSCQSDTAVPPAPTFALPPLQIDAVRVDTRRLDDLMNHTGELVVTRTRATQRMLEIQQLQDQVTELTRQRPGLDELETALQAVRQAHAEDVARLELLSNALEESVRQMRLLPLATVFRLFPRMVRDLSAEQGKTIVFRLEGEETVADKRILEDIKDPLMHLLRNAVDHGIEDPSVREGSGKPAQGVITLAARCTANEVQIELRDDGAGLDLGAIRATAARRGLFPDEELVRMAPEQLHALIFAPGFSTRAEVTDVSGRGVGMDVVRANVERLKGEIEVSSTPGQGTRFLLRLPMTVATVRVLVMQVNGYCYGVPVAAVAECRRVGTAEVFAMAGRDTVLYRGLPVPVADLAGILDLPAQAADTLDPEGTAVRSCVLLQSGSDVFGVFADALLDEQDMLVKPLSPLLPAGRLLRGAAILNSGEVCMVLEASGLLSALFRGSTVARVVPADPAPRRKTILLAEDSITTRAQEIRILEGAGYEVVAASDGLDALGKLATRPFDAVVSDINMPRLDGLELAARIRSLPQHAELPIVLVTSLASAEDKRRGLEIGANAYITKPEFDQTMLLDCLERLIG